MIQLYKSLTAPQHAAEVNTDSNVANKDEILDKTNGNTALKHFLCPFNNEWFLKSSTFPIQREFPMF